MSETGTYHVIWWRNASGTELMTGPFDSYDHVLGWMFDYRMRKGNYSGDFRPVWIGDLSGVPLRTVKNTVADNRQSAVTKRIPWGEKFSVEAS